MLPMAVVSSSISSRPRLGSVVTGETRSPREMSSALRLSERRRVTRASTAGSRSASTSVSALATRACTAQLALRTKCSVPTSTIARRKCETRILLCSESDTGWLRSSRAAASFRAGAGRRPVRAAGNSSSTERRTVPFRVGGGTSAIRAAILAQHGPDFTFRSRVWPAGYTPPHTRGRGSGEERSIFLDPAGELPDAVGHPRPRAPAEGLRGAGDVGDEDRLVPGTPVGEGRAQRASGETVQLLDQLEE